MAVLTVLVTVSTVPILSGVGRAGSYFGTRFTPGNCIYCPMVTQPPSYSFPSGAMVKVAWYEIYGHALSLSVGPTWGASLPCPSGEQTGGSCTFVSQGGTYTLFFHAPYPATESGYSTNYTVTWVDLGPFAPLN